MFVEERHQEILRLLNENEKICYQWENNYFQMIHSMIEYKCVPVIERRCSHDYRGKNKIL